MPKPPYTRKPGTAPITEDGPFTSLPGRMVLFAVTGGLLVTVLGLVPCGVLAAEPALGEGARLGAVQLGMVVLLGLCAAFTLYIFLERWFVRPYRGLAKVHDGALTELGQAQRARAAAQAIIEAAADGFLAVDGERRILLVNDNFLNLWGLTRDDVMNADMLMRALSRETRAPHRFMQRVEHIYAQCRLATDDHLDLRDGRVLGRYTRPLMDEEEVAGRVWCFRDITDQVRADRALRGSHSFIRAVLNSAADAILTLTNHLRIDTANRAALTMLGYTEGELVGRRIHDFIGPERVLTKFLDAPRRSPEAAPRQAEVELTTREGELLPAELTVTRLNLPGDVTYTLILHDITQRKRAERAVAEARAQEKTIAARIQETLLIGKMPSGLGKLDVAAASEPSQMVDGDFYEFQQFHQHDNVLDVVVGDVMGKGVAAALLGAATLTHLRQALSGISHRHSDFLLPAPSDIVQALHGRVAREFIALETFVTLCYARFDPDLFRLELVDCGHTETIHVCGATGAVQFIKGDNLPLGVMEEEQYHQRTLHFQPGDLFMFYSDGITEAVGAEGDFGRERLAAILQGAVDRTAAEVVDLVDRGVRAFAAGAPARDDMTLVAVKVPVAPDAAWRRCQESFSSAFEQLEEIRLFVREACSRVAETNLDSDDRLRVELAVNEAAANVMKHAYQGDTDKRLDIEVDVAANLLAVRIYDTGRPFDEHAVPLPSFDGSREDGFGLYIMSQVFDEVDHSREPQGRNCVAMIKRFQGGAGFESRGS